MPFNLTRYKQQLEERGEVFISVRDAMNAGQYEFISKEEVTIFIDRVDQIARAFESFRFIR